MTFEIVGGVTSRAVKAFSDSSSPVLKPSVVMTLIRYLSPARRVDVSQMYCVSSMPVASGIHVALSYRHSLDNDTWSEWTNTTMNPETSTMFSSEIPELTFAAHVQYKIFAEDYSNNSIVNDNFGYFYIYTVVPEHPLTLAIILLATTTLLVVVDHGERRKIASNPRE